MREKRINKILKYMKIKSIALCIPRTKLFINGLLKMLKKIYPKAKFKRKMKLKILRFHRLKTILKLMLNLKMR